MLEEHIELPPNSLDDVRDPPAQNEVDENNECCNQFCTLGCYPRFIASTSMIITVLKIFFLFILDILIILAWITLPVLQPTIVVLFVLTSRSISSTVTAVYSTIQQIVYINIALSAVLYIFHIMIIFHQITVYIYKKTARPLPHNYSRKIMNIYYVSISVSIVAIILELILVMICVGYTLNVFYVSISALFAPLMIFLVWVHEERSYEFFVLSGRR